MIDETHSDAYSKSKIVTLPGYPSWTLRGEKVFPNRARSGMERTAPTGTPPSCLLSPECPGGRYYYERGMIAWSTEYLPEADRPSTYRNGGNAGDIHAWVSPANSFIAQAVEVAAPSPCYLDRLRSE